MEPRNFSSPDATEKSREARLNKLRERRAKAVTSNSDSVLRPISAEVPPRLGRSPESNRSPEPILDNRFSNRSDRRSEGRIQENKVKPLPNRQGFVEARPEQRSDNRTELRPRKKSNGNNRTIPIKSPIKLFGWHVLRLAIAGIGLSVIAGTAISFWQNQQSISAKTNATELAAKEEANKSPDIAPLELKTEAVPLLSKVKELAAKEKDLTMQMMVVDLDSGAYVQVGANQPIAAASTIKTPILVAFFQDVDAGKIKLDEQLEMTADVKVGEAGDFQLLPTGTKISALETATQMIVISDNTATNMIIKRLGGLAVLNQRFKSWGLNNMVIKNQLPDLEGTNTISTQDMVTLLSMLDKGKLIEPRSRDRFMDIMRRPVTNTLLPKGLGEEARIIHKTGDIGSAVGDAGIVDMPNGKRYAIAVMVKRPDNDQRANELIRQISRTTYEYFLNGGSLPASNNSSPVNPIAPASQESNDSINSPTPNNGGSGTSIIENITLPLPNATPNLSPSTSPNSSPSFSNPSEVTRQNP